MSGKEQGETAKTEEQEEPVKPVFWIGRSLQNLQSLSEEVRQVIGFALWQAQQGGKHVDAKPLKGFGGASVLEIVADERGSTFRGVYTVQFEGAVYALHVFQKKSKKGIETPKKEIELVRKRLKMAAEHHKQWQLSKKKGNQHEKSKKANKGDKK
jgi:phage-related protein